MAENSKIEWTHHTFNPWIGCAKVAPGCAHCYAEAFSNRYHKAAWGPHGTRVLTSDANWKKPLKWNREAEQAMEARRVFCASLADVFEEFDGPLTHHRGQTLRVGLGDARQALFEMIDATPQLDWLLLTKRPENIRRMWPTMAKGLGGSYRPNVWLGTSVATQRDADRNLPLLAAFRELAPVLFVSAEPLLERIAFHSDWAPINWWIVGGESGPQAGACNADWILAMVDRCRLGGIPCFVKQLGASPVVNGVPMRFRDGKGGEIETWPRALQVRQFPLTRAAGGTPGLANLPLRS